MAYPEGKGCRRMIGSSPWPCTDTPKFPPFLAQPGPGCSQPPAQTHLVIRAEHECCDIFFLILGKQREIPQLNHPWRHLRAPFSTRLCWHRRQLGHHPKTRVWVRSHPPCTPGSRELCRSSEKTRREPREALRSGRARHLLQVVQESSRPHIDGVDFAPARAEHELPIAAYLENRDREQER